MPIISNIINVNTLEDGEDAAVAFCSPDKISIQCNTNGSVVASSGYRISFTLKVGTHTATITSVTAGSLPTGVSVTATPVAYAKTLGVTTSATAVGMASGVTFTVTGSYGGNTYYATITVALIGVIKGSTGNRGKVGRFFYYGGVFNSQDSTTAFVVNDAQAPYFEHTESNQKRYHVYDPETNPSGGTITMSEMWQNSSSSWNNAPWEAMTNDFKYLITEALFADFAKLGSFIFSGDWMVSRYGIIYDTSGGAHVIDATNTWTFNGVVFSPDNAFTLFKSDYPNSSMPNNPNFAPYLALDGLTGETYQQKAHVEGSIKSGQYTESGLSKYANEINEDGSGKLAKGEIYWDADGNSEFSGVLKAPMVYSPSYECDGTVYAITDVKARTFIHSYGRNTTVFLPKASDYQGLEIQFFAPLLTRSYVGDLYVKCQQSSILVPDEYNIYDSAAYGVKIEINNLVTFKAINQDWFLVSGNVTVLTS